MVLLLAACTPSAPPPEPSKLEPSKLEPAELEPAKLEPAKLEPAKLAPTKPAATPVFVLLGRESAPFASLTRKPAKLALLGPSWGWTESEAGSKPEGAVALFEKLGVKLGESAFVAPDEIASWKVPTPQGPIWLIGPEAPCKATVGRPMIGFHSIAEAEQPIPDASALDAVVELAWELTGCSIADPSQWSPVGLAAATVDPELRWVAAVIPKTYVRFDPSPNAWTGPLPEQVASVVAEAKHEVEGEEVLGPADWWTQTITLPGVDFTEVYVAGLWRTSPAPSEQPASYQCEDLEFGRTLNVRGAQAIELPNEYRGKLFGALAARGLARFTIYSSGPVLDIAVLEPETTTVADLLTLDTGGYYPESFDDPGHSVIGYCGP